MLSHFVTGHATSNGIGGDGAPRCSIGHFSRLVRERGCSVPRGCCTVFHVILAVPNVLLQNILS